MMGPPNFYKMTLWAVVLMSALNTALNIPLKQDESNRERGPRKELNETGRYLYSLPDISSGLFLCKKCSHRALSDDTYTYEQQYQCISQNHHLPDSRETAPYCNTGEDLTCGPPEFNPTYAHWICDRGYSRTVHSVYSTCRLICNVTNTSIAKIYCRETLEWYEDVSPTGQCKGPVKDEGDESSVVIILFGVLGSVIVVGLVVVACICLCKRVKSSRPSTPVTVDENDQKKAFIAHVTNKSEDKPGEETPLSDSIGHCSIECTDIDILLGEGNDQKPSKVTISTSTTNLNSPDDDEPTAASQNSQHSTGENTSCGVSSAGRQHSVLNSSARSDTTQGSNGCSCGAMGPVLVDENESAHSDRSQPPRSNEDNDGLRQSTGSREIEAPYPRVFSPSTRTSGSGLDNLRLQKNAYKLPRGQTVYFVPSMLDVTSMVISRKDDGPEFRGVQTYLARDMIIITLDLVRDEDAGVFRWTMIRSINGVDYPFHGTLELFVGEPGPDAVNYMAPVSQVVVNEETQRSVLEPNASSNSTNRDNQQRLNSERLPPEGAENDAHQVSTQTNPLHAGARPKTYTKTSVRNQPTVTYVSGNSGTPDRVVEDQPTVKRFESRTLSNDLNKVGKESENNVDQFNSPRNISSYEKNLFSVEDNMDHDANLVSQDVQTNSTTPSRLDVGSILSSKGNPSSGMNDLSPVRSSEVGEIGNEMTMSKNQTDSVELLSNILEDLKSDEYHLDPNELFSSEKPSANSVSNNSRRSLGQERSLGQPRLLGQERSLGQPRSLSHLNPDTISSELQRPEPSGRNEQPDVIEQYRNFDETEVKGIYNGDTDVRGERSPENSSNFNQPLAQVRLTSNDIAHPERSANISEAISTGPVPQQFPPREEPAQEASEETEGAVGGIPAVNGGRLHAVSELYPGPLECITLLANLRDGNCLKELCYHGNPIDKHGEARCWYGLCLFYGYARHYLDAVKFALRERIHDGAMHHAVTDLLAKENFTIGHLVFYFTQRGTENPEIVDLLIDKCKDHKHCRYCEELRRVSRRQRGTYR